MKPKQRKATGVLKKLIDEFEALPEAEQKHIMKCTACEVPECNELTRSLCGYPSNTHELMAWLATNLYGCPLVFDTKPVRVGVKKDHLGGPLWLT